MSRQHTHYDNLKVSHAAPPEVIRAAYKALSQRYHPDKNSSPDATRIMKILNEAYEVLGDPERRHRYDASLQEQADESRAAEDAKQSSKEQEPPRQAEPEGPTAAESEHPTASNVRPTERSATAKKRSGWFWIIGIMVAILVRLVATSSHNSASINSAVPSSFAADASTNVSKPELPASGSGGRDDPKLITSYDCKKAHSASERLVCNDAELASLDLSLAAVFAQAKGLASDKRMFADAARRNWNWRNANCFDKACLVSWYNEQRERLIAVINESTASAAATQATVVNTVLPSGSQSGFVDSSQSATSRVIPKDDPAPSTFYAERVAGRVRPNIIWSGETDGLETVVAVRAGRTGTLLSASILHSSGNDQWDAAALRAVERSDPLPLDIGGEAPAAFNITLRPSGGGLATPQSGRDKALAWMHALKQQHADADSAYDIARHRFASIKASCPDAILLQQTPQRPSQYRPVIMFISQQCGYIASYWPETGEEQTAFDRSTIENWISYCPMSGPPRTTCLTSDQG